MIQISTVHIVGQLYLNYHPRTNYESLRNKSINLSASSKTDNLTFFGLLPQGLNHKFLNTREPFLVFYVILISKNKIELNSPPTTAILVFAHSATKELEYKPIPKGERLFDALGHSTLKKAKRTGLPLFHFTEKEQIGSTFGERFTNAIASVFEQGFEHVITIGNDTPQLQTHHLQKAAQQLALGKTVIGPSTDGGFYLLGIQQKNFNATVLKDMPWQRIDLFHKISHWFEHVSCELIKLPIFQDIDDTKDLKAALHFSKTFNFVLRKLVIHILGYTFVPLVALITTVNLFLHTPLYNKGSPKVLLA